MVISTIDELPLEPTVDEQVGASGQLLACDSRLERAHRGGPDGDDSPSGTSGVEARLHRLGGHPIALRVHRVVERVVRADRLERVEADDQFDRRTTDPEAVEPSEQLPGEVQSGGRRSRRTRFVGEHGLIALRVVEPFTDVRRKRHLTVAVEQRQWVLVAEEFDHEGVAGRRPLPHPDQIDAAGRQDLAEAQLAARPHERLPAPSLGVERLRAAAPRLHLRSDASGGAAPGSPASR